MRSSRILALYGCLLLLLVCCYSCIQSSGLNYLGEPIQGVAGTAIPSSLVILRPFDDRYLAERIGESPSYSSIILLYGIILTHRIGNWVTADRLFESSVGLFGDTTVSSKVGDGLAQAAKHGRWADSVRTDSGPAPSWVAGRDPDMVAVCKQIAADGSTWGLLTRIKHLHGVSFLDEKERGRVSQSQTHYEVSGQIVSASTKGFGNCVLELLLVDCSGPDGPKLVRRTVRSNSMINVDSRKTGHQLTFAASIAFRKAMTSASTVVREMAEQMTHQPR